MPFFWFSSSVTKSLVRCLRLNDWLNPCDRWWRNATPSHSNVWGRVTALLSINETRFASLTVSHSIKRHQAVETDKNSTPLLNPQTRFHSKCVSASKKSNWRPNRPSRRSLTFCAEPVFKPSDPNLNPRRFTLFPSTTHFITKDHKRRMKGWFDRVSWRKSGRNEEESLPFFFYSLNPVLFYCPKLLDIFIVCIEIKIQRWCAKALKVSVKTSMSVEGAQMQIRESTVLFLIFHPPVVFLYSTHSELLS